MDKDALRLDLPIIDTRTPLRSKVLIEDPGNVIPLVGARNPTRSEFPGQ